MIKNQNAKTPSDGNKAKVSQPKTAKAKTKITRKNAPAYIEAAINRKDYGEALDLVRRFRTSGFVVTKSTLKREFDLKDSDIEKLKFHEADNPYYKCAPPMKLYLKAEAILLKEKILTTLNNAA